MHIFLIYNPFSGYFIDQAADQSVQNYFHGLLEAKGLSDIRLQAFNVDCLPDWEREWQQDKPQALWVAGGDGTVSALAVIAARLAIPLGILPGGTMNLLARDLGMALDIELAIDQLLHAKTAYIDIAQVNQHPFFCLSNLGMANRLTERREKLRQTSRWLRWPLLFGYLLKFLFAYPPMLIRLDIDGRIQQIRTRAASVSNNPLASESWLIPKRDSLNKGVMGVYVTRDTSFWSLPRLTLKLLMGKWQQDADLTIYTAQQLTIRFRRKRRTRVMTDGELIRLNTPLEYRIKPQALPVLKPVTTDP